MYRSLFTSRLARASLRSSSISNAGSRRFLTTEPPHKTSRSWKNSATRWTLAIGGVYWYNTTPLFAEQPQYNVQNQEPPLPTLESLSRASRFAPPSDHDLPVLPVQPTSNSPPSIDPKSPLPDSLDAPTQSPEDLEAEAGAQGAFNEETGEINWDCPCLGGMAHGPCGEEFRAAFSCFVFSKEEPKGMDCVDKFKGMQTCFREHPEEYGDQLDEDEEEVEREIAAQQSQKEQQQTSGESEVEGTADVVEKKDESEVTKASSTKRSIYDSDSARKTPDTQTNDTGKASPASGDKSKQDTAGDEGDRLVPKAAHDATGESVKTSK